MILAYSSEQFNECIIQALSTHAGGALSLSAVERPFDAEWQLREGDCDVALVSPLIYSTQEADFTLVPDAAITAMSATGDLLLVFNPGLHDFSTVAVRSIGNIDSILAQIVLREKYDMQPRVVEYRGTPQEALHACDAVLIRLHDDDDFIGSHHETIDIIDEWFDMTQLPFVRQVFIGWDLRLTAEVCARIAAACAAVDARSIDVQREHLKEGFSTDSLHALPGHYRYTLDDDCIEALNRFFQLAYFHGLHRDIPTFRIWAQAEV
jgi:predicted solute-binding protein